MFTFGWAEIFLVGIIIIIVIGPKDLPKFIKQISLLVKNIRKISSDFKSSLNEITEESEIKELAKSVKEVKKIKDGINIKKNFENEIKTVKETVNIAKNEISEIENGILRLILVQDEVEMFGRTSVQHAVVRDYDANPIGEGNGTIHRELILENGSEYEGRYEAGKWHGKGILMKANGMRYEGVAAFGV